MGCFGGAADRNNIVITAGPVKLMGQLQYQGPKLSKLAIKADIPARSNLVYESFHL